MSLIELIGQYKTDLNVPFGVGIQGVVDKYREFSQELVELSSFRYTKDDMRRTVEFMRNLDFNRDARCYILLYAIRRAALKPVLGVSARKEIWKLLELADFISDEEGVERLEESTKDYVARVGKTKVEENLLKFRNGLKKVEGDVDKLYRVVREDDIISVETAENHSRHIALEMTQLGEIIKMIRKI